MNVRPVTEADLAFVCECLVELRGKVQYTVESFVDYVRRNGLLDHQEFRILVGESEGTPVGMLTCNRFAMPRYLGFGYEVEEVVVHPAHQGRGHGKDLIAAFLDEVAKDPDVRKVLVKTDDERRAGRVYSHFMDLVHTNVYARTINRL